MRRILRALYSHYGSKVVRLHQAGATGSATMQRHAVVIGALVTRLCFELYGLPQEARAVVPAA